jgi:threonine/homoserine/homoserine lactone efflux protein
MDPQLAAYLVFTTLLVFTPGSATAVVVRNVLDGGRRQGMAAAVGAAAGNTTYAVLAGVGLASLFAHRPAAFLILRVAGTLYLAWLGARSLRAAWRPPPPALPGALERQGAGEAVSATREGFSQGLANNLVNPAIATFYLAVVPSFLNGGSTRTSRYVLFAAIHVTMAFAYHSGWVWALHALRAFWAKPAARRTLETLTGIALIALAARVAGAI